MFNRWDICDAYYLFASLYHGGQWGAEYEIFGRLDAIRYDPRLGLCDRNDLSENGQAIFDGLVERWATEQAGFRIINNTIQTGNSRNG